MPLAVRQRLRKHLGSGVHATEVHCSDGIVAAPLRDVWMRPKAMSALFASEEGVKTEHTSAAVTAWLSHCRAMTNDGHNRSGVEERRASFRKAAASTGRFAGRGEPAIVVDRALAGVCMDSLADAFNVCSCTHLCNIMLIIAVAAYFSVHHRCACFKHPVHGICLSRILNLVTPLTRSDPERVQKKKRTTPLEHCASASGGAQHG